MQLNLKKVKLRTMKIQKNLSEMTIEELKKLVMGLAEKNIILKKEIKLLKEELARTKKSRPSQ